MNVALNLKLFKVLMILLWTPLVLIGVVLGIAMTPLYIGHRLARFSASMFQVSVLDKLKT